MIIGPSSPRRTARLLRPPSPSQEFDGVAHRHDRLGRVIGNFDAEFFLESHDELDRVERIGTEVVDEIGIVHDLVGIHAEMLHDDLLHTLGDITHRLVLVLAVYAETSPAGDRACD